MNWLKKLWNSLISKTSTSPKLVVVDEEPAPVEVEEDNSELVGEILWEVLLEQGVRPSEIRNAKIKELFDAWYDGPCTKKSIVASIGDFKKAHSISFGCD